MLTTGDVFHTGFVVEDLDAAKRELGSLFELEWTPVEEREMPLRGPDGPFRPTLRFTYTRQGPHRLELLEATPGTIWMPPVAAAGGTLAAHHIGVWCDDLAATSRRLVADGAPRLATYDGDGEDAVGFAYHRLPTGALIELVDSARRPGFDQWFAGGPFPVGG